MFLNGLLVSYRCNVNVILGKSENIDEVEIFIYEC